MGITGLLPFLKKIQREVHISSFKGKKVAIDAYCWLHKGSYSCAMQLVMKSEKLESLPFVKYCIKRVNLLRQNGVTPILVFDGGYLPTKANTEKERREKRQGYRTKGKELLKVGKRSEAMDCFQRSVDVSPEMALALIKECRKLGVECIVAPYEADAQLAYLQKEGIVDFVITEDSDLLVFGCQRVLYKMDESGNGKLIELQDLGKANNVLIGFTQDSFRQMCILSGCDYLPSIPGIGLGKSSKLMKKHNQNPKQVIRALHYETGKVPPDYEDNFRKAEYTFLYQLVFDPRTQRQVRLNELPDDVDPDEFEFAGITHSPRKAVHMARGNINPITHEVLDNYSPSKAPPPKSTSWSASAMGNADRQYPVAIQARLTTLMSTEGTKRQFKPPKRLHQPMEETDTSLKDEELQSMYMTSTMSEASSSSLGTTCSMLTSGTQEPPKQTVFSRFFQHKETSLEVNSTDQTPCEEGSLLLTRNSARRLLLNDEDSQSSTPLSLHYDQQLAPELTSFNQSKLTKKRLFPHDNTDSSEGVSKLSDVYSYSRVKKLRHGDEKEMECDPLSLLDKTQTFETNDNQSPGKYNPFSKVSPRMSPAKLIQRDSIVFMECSQNSNTSETNAEMQSLHIEDSQSLSQTESTLSRNHSSASLKFMTSDDFLTTRGEDPCNSGMSLSQGSESVRHNPTVTEETPQFYNIDLTEGGSARNQHRKSHLPLSKTPLLPNSTSNRRFKQVGLSRRGSKSRQNKPAEAGYRQTTLSGFSYVKRPQL